MENQSFAKLTKAEKIEFFVKCQELLLKYHPNSEYTFNDSNLKVKLEHIKDLAIKYKGFCHTSENVCLFYNKIKVTDINNPIAALKDNMYQEPKEDYNAMSIDFVAFRKLEDCLDFCKSNYDPKIRYIMFIRNGKPKIYETAKFLSSLLGIPISKSKTF